MLAVLAEHGQALWLVAAQAPARVLRWHGPAMDRLQVLPGPGGGAPRLWLANRHGEWLCLDSGTGAVLARHALAQVPGHPAGQAVGAWRFSRDGRWLLTAPPGAGELCLIDTKSSDTRSIDTRSSDTDWTAAAPAAWRVARRWPLRSATGQVGTQGAALLDAPARRSLLVLPADLAEVWEISLDPQIEDHYEGLVHDFRMGEGVPVRAYLHPRRLRLPGPLHQPALDPEGHSVWGRIDSAGLQAWHLDTRRRAHHAAQPPAVLSPAAGDWWPSPTDTASAAGTAPALLLPDPQAPRLWAWAPERATPWRSLPLPTPAQRLCHTADGALWWLDTASEPGLWRLSSLATATAQPWGRVPGVRDLARLIDVKTPA